MKSSGSLFGRASRRSGYGRASHTVSAMNAPTSRTGIPASQAGSLNNHPSTRRNTCSSGSDVTVQQNSTLRIGDRLAVAASTIRRAARMQCFLQSPQPVMVASSSTSVGVSRMSRPGGSTQNPKGESTSAPGGTGPPESASPFSAARSARRESEVGSEHPALRWFLSAVLPLSRTSAQPYCMIWRGAATRPANCCPSVGRGWIVGRTWGTYCGWSAVMVIARPLWVALCT